MTNSEKYKDELSKIAVIGILAKKNGELVRCAEASCLKCDFFDEERSCLEIKKEWLDSEYKEPETDWTKVPIGTKIVVRSSDKDEWKLRPLILYVEGIYYPFITSEDFSMTSEHVGYYSYGRLATPEEIEKYAAEN